MSIRRNWLVFLVLVVIGGLSTGCGQPGSTQVSEGTVERNEGNATPPEPIDASTRFDIFVRDRKYRDWWHWNQANDASNGLTVVF